MLLFIFLNKYPTAYKSKYFSLLINLFQKEGLGLMMVSLFKTRWEFLQRWLGATLQANPTTGKRVLQQSGLLSFCCLRVSPSVVKDPQPLWSAVKQGMPVIVKRSCDYVIIALIFDRNWIHYHFFYVFTSRFGSGECLTTSDTQGYSQWVFCQQWGRADGCGPALNASQDLWCGK